MNPQIGKLLLWAGLAIAAVGILIIVAGDKLSWFGRLPGDIRIEKENYKVYFPITSLILISLLLNLLIFLIRKFSN